MFIQDNWEDEEEEKKEEEVKVMEPAKKSKKKLLSVKIAEKEVGIFKYSILILWLFLSYQINTCLRVYILGNLDIQDK